MTQAQVDDQLNRPTSPLTHEQKERLRAEIKSGTIRIIEAPDPDDEDVVTLRRTITDLRDKLELAESHNSTLRAEIDLLTADIEPDHSNIGAALGVDDIDGDIEPSQLASVDQDQAIGKAVGEAKSSKGKGKSKG